MEYTLIIVVILAINLTSYSFSHTKFIKKMFICLFSGGILEWDTFNVLLDAEHIFSEKQNLFGFCVYTVINFVSSLAITSVCSHIIIWRCERNLNESMLSSTTNSAFSGYCPTSISPIPPLSNQVISYPYQYIVHCFNEMIEFFILKL